MDEVKLFEQIIAGTIGTTAVLGICAYVLWKRLTAREAEHAAAMDRKDAAITTTVEKVTTALNSLRDSVDENTQVSERLREAITQKR